MTAVAHSFGALVFERLFYSATAGTALVLLVSVALRLRPARNSHTRFAVWFATLIAVVALPFFAFVPQQFSTSGIRTVPHALFTVPSSWAEYAVLAWALLAAVGVARLGFGLWQLRSFRRDAVELDGLAVSEDIRALMGRFSGRRGVRLLVSSRVQVPTAIGFLRPAILLPAWLVEDVAGKNENVANENLKLVLLHELAHLRRWDDWTNLVQKLIKTIFFFHPGILWIERNLALDREMACDDAVLAETGSPRNYAHCLANLAEKSFLRRQLALAQAAVSHMKQLSRRVAGILDGQRPRGTRIWKPAIPMVAGAAVLCAVSASSTTELIGFTDGAHGTAVASIQGASSNASPQLSSLPIRGDATAPNVGRGVGVIQAKMNEQPAVQAIPADLKFSPRRQSHQYKTNSTRRTRPIQRVASTRMFTTAKLEPPPMIASPAMIASKDAQAEITEQARNRKEVILVIFTSERVSHAAASGGWQVNTVNTWELYFYRPAPAKQVPSKT